MATLIRKDSHRGLRRQRPAAMAWPIATIKASPCSPCAATSGAPPTSCRLMSRCCD